MSVTLQEAPSFSNNRVARSEPTAYYSAVHPDRLAPLMSAPREMRYVTMARSLRSIARWMGRSSKESYGSSRLAPRSTVSATMFLDAVRTPCCSSRSRTNQSWRYGKASTAMSPRRRAKTRRRVCPRPRFRTRDKVGAVEDYGSEGAVRAAARRLNR